MKKRILPLLAAVALLAACGEETRTGTLTLSGSQPVRVIDQSGAAVDFVSGPLKTTFGVDGSRKFTVVLEQNGRKAKFSGQVPSGVSDWNVTLKGRTIGQPIDIASTRSVQYVGQPWTTMGMGEPCGMNGQWETEQTWQKGNESWNVAFNDAATGAALGAFASQKTDDYLLSSRNTWCRERPMPQPMPYPHGRWNQISGRLGDLQQAGVSFDGAK